MEINEILIGSKTSEDRKSTTKNIKTLIELFDDYSRIVSEAKYKAKQEKGLKILRPNQMLQRLPVALAQVKVGNTSENLLN